MEIEPSQWTIDAYVAQVSNENIYTSGEDTSIYIFITYCIFIKGFIKVNHVENFPPINLASSDV